MLIKLVSRARGGPGAQKEYGNDDHKESSRSYSGRECKHRGNIDGDHESTWTAYSPGQFSHAKAQSDQNAVVGGVNRNGPATLFGAENLGTKPRSYSNPVVGGDIYHRKVELPNFSGDNLEGWIFQAERYFTLYGTTEEENNLGYWIYWRFVGLSKHQ
ncbi:hypothetical protein E2542_SST26653 [Spatholobus suberectus]|nr:hypothetical protein E2542_SST26653 [Spatholobus suberectus]